MTTHPSIPALLERQRELDALAIKLRHDRNALVEAGGASPAVLAHMRRAEGGAVDAANCCKVVASMLRRQDAEIGAAIQAVG